MCSVGLVAHCQGQCVLGVREKAKCPWYVCAGQAWGRSVHGLLTSCAPRLVEDKQLASAAVRQQPCPHAIQPSSQSVPSSMQRHGRTEALGLTSPGALGRRLVYCTVGKER